MKIFPLAKKPVTSFVLPFLVQLYCLSRQALVLNQIHTWRQENFLIPIAHGQENKQSEGKRALVSTGTVHETIPLDMNDNRDFINEDNEVDAASNQKNAKVTGSSLFLGNSPATKKAKENRQLSPSYRLSRQALDLVHSVLDTAQNVLDNTQVHEASKKEKNKKSEEQRAFLHKTIALTMKDDSQLEDAEVDVTTDKKRARNVIANSGDSAATTKAKENRQLSPSYRLSRQALDLVHSVLDTAQNVLDNTQMHETSTKEKSKKSEEQRESVHEAILTDNNDDSQLQDTDTGGINASMNGTHDSKNAEVVSTVDGNKTMQKRATQSSCLAEQAQPKPHVPTDSAVLARKVGKISRDKKLLMIMIMHTVQKWSKTQRESVS